MIEYNGKAYSLRSYNCWDHACKVRADHGIDTKVFRPDTLKDAFSLIGEQMKESGHGLRSISEPGNYDIVIVSGSAQSKLSYHCGVYFNGFVSHCCRAKKQVTIDSYNDFVSKYDEVTFWR